ncbi:glutathione S-transferase-like [Arctopsyche grandis]|uniref:glutathione S-transferase-like n=1 Tax=Arctopsyche grandis TaxID=121162 RepID=UPI00406D71D5
MSVNTEKHGAAESIRYLLHFAGEKLGNLRQTIEQWLKTIDDGDKSMEINHAVAVARCIGAVSGLITGDHWIDANLDTIAFKIYEILKIVETWYKETDKKKKSEMFEHMKKNVFDCCFASFEKIVNDNGGHFSKKLTWLDFFFVGAIEVLEFYLGVNVIDGKYPALLRLAKKIWELPEIKDYISKRESKNQI